MSQKLFKYGFYIFSLLLFTQSCTEPFVPETKTFENILVVEGTITNELKTQKIKITRTYTFEEDHSETVTDAKVFVSNDTGKKYPFQYSAEDSMYVSVSKFQAKQGKQYSLNITTSNGETYTSTPEPLPATSHVSLSLEKKEVNGEFGVQIMASSYDPSNSSNYYRYEYIETYKVIPPKWGKYKAIIEPAPDSISLSGYIMKAIPRKKKTRICYATKYSKDIKLTKTTEKTEDRITDFPIRFIAADSYILKYKYSILVKQYVVNYESYIFYRTLKKVAGSDGTVLSPNQPGFVNGNLSAVGNSNKKIIGYFSVASVSTERIFLDDYKTLFPNLPLPDFFNECNILKLDITPKTDPRDKRPDHYRLLTYIRNDIMFLYRLEAPNSNIFWMVLPPCTDCTTFASNEKPEFWP